MGKRKNDYFRDARSNYYGKKKKYEMRKQSSGVLITLGTSFRINEGCLEFFNILESQAPFLFSSQNYVTDKNQMSQDSIHSSTHVTISDKVLNELNEIKQCHSPLEKFDQLVKGVSFFQFDSHSPKSPNETIYDILQHIKTSMSSNMSSTSTETPLTKKLQLSCRFVHRVLPIDITCSPHPLNIYKAAQQLIKEYFPQSAIALMPHDFLHDIIKTKLSEHNNTIPLQPTKQDCDDPLVNNHTDIETYLSASPKEITSSLPFTPTFTVPVNATWSLVIERRGGMKTIEREQLIPKIGAYVGTNYKVNLSQPQYTLLIQILPAFCGLSVLRSYNDLVHYNLHRLCHPDLYPHQKSNT